LGELDIVFWRDGLAPFGGVTDFIVKLSLKNIFINTLGCNPELDMG
jgi:hypothetical protein